MVRYKEQSDATFATPHFQVTSAATARWKSEDLAKTFEV